MRTEPAPSKPSTAAATPRQGDAHAEPAAPRREGRMAFEAALNRAGRGGRGPLGDEERGPDADARAPLFTDPALPTPMSRQAEPPATAWAPQPVRAPDALTRQLQAAPDPMPVSNHWQLQILQTGLPAQTLDVQRSPAGPINIVLTARPEAQHTEPSSRLRQRLAARGGAPATLDFRAPAHEPDE